MIYPQSVSRFMLAAVHAVIGRWCGARIHTKRKRLKKFAMDLLQGRMLVR